MVISNIQIPKPLVYERFGLQGSCRVLWILQDQSGLRFQRSPESLWLSPIWLWINSYRTYRYNFFGDEHATSYFDVTGF